MDLRPLSPGALGVALLLSAGGCDGSGRGGERDGAPAPAVRYQQHVSAGSVAPPADSLANPLAGDTSAVASGERLFVAMNCDGCHGGGATGWAAPSLVDGRWRYGGGDGALYHSIFYGRPRGMPAYGGVLSATTIWQLVSYLRSRPEPGVVPTQAWP